MKNQKKFYSPIEPIKPDEPSREDCFLFGAQNEKVIYRDVSLNGDPNFSIEEHFKDIDEELPPTPKKRYWQNLSLKDIIDLLPPNTDLSSVIFKIYMPRYLEYTDISFVSYERNLELEEKQYLKNYENYKKDMKKYEKDLLKYEEDLKKYNEFVKQEEISKLEEQLKQLKNEK